MNDDNNLNNVVFNVRYWRELPPPAPKVASGICRVIPHQPIQNSHFRYSQNRHIGASSARNFY
jgi:hypothetical protein